MKKIISKNTISPYFFIGAFITAFAIMFAINFVLPIRKVFLIPFYNIQQRSWVWFELIICALASYFILKTRKFTPSDLVISVILAVTVKYTGYRDVSAISTIVCYYSACQIFREYNQQNKYFNISAQNFIKSLFFGALLAVPFAAINNLAIYMTNHQLMSFNMSNIWKSAFSALSPGISEEIIFHFFLLAFITYIFKGNIPKNKATIFLVYFLCVVPHCLIHLPVVFTQNFTFGIFILLFTSLLFGTPMVWLVKNKNLQTAIAFHWMVDFIRFIFVIYNNSL